MSKQVHSKQPGLHNPKRVATWKRSPTTDALAIPGRLGHTCKIQVDADHIREKILNQEIPYCGKCKVNDDDVKSASDSKPSEVSNNDLVSPDEMNLEKAASDEVNETLVYKKNNSAGILKPDIVFFGEGLPELYHQSIGEDKNKCDLLIVIGSSLKVKPVANIPRKLNYYYS